jgi:hypothetical protein
MYEAVACYENVPKYVCEEVYGDGDVFAYNACDTSVYSYCYAEGDCIKITSSFTKDDCKDIGNGMLVTPNVCPPDN